MDTTKNFDGYAKDYTAGRPNYATQLIDGIFNNYGLSGKHRKDWCLLIFHFSEWGIRCTILRFCLGISADHWYADNKWQKGIGMPAEQSATMCWMPAIY